MLPFANISYLISPIDHIGCGGLFGVDTVVMHIQIYDSPGGSFSFVTPGVLLDEDTVIGGAPGSSFDSFNWVQCGTSLDISSSVDGNITVVFDLFRSGYAAIDNIEIKSSVTSTTLGNSIQKESLAVFPNPFNDWIQLEGTEEGSVIIIFDASGVELIRMNSTKGRTVLDTQELTPGLYWVQQIGERGVAQASIVKW